MPLKFLADENIAPTVVKALREAGYDVRDIKEDKLSGLSDKKIIDKARTEDRIILTHDRDFGNLVNFPIKSHKGVVLIRYKDNSPKNVAKKLIPLIEILRGKLKYALVIVTDEAIKIQQK